MCTTRGDARARVRALERRRRVDDVPERVGIGVDVIIGPRVSRARLRPRDDDIDVDVRWVGFPIVGRARGVHGRRRGDAERARLGRAQTARDRRRDGIEIEPSRR